MIKENLEKMKSDLDLKEKKILSYELKNLKNGRDIGIKIGKGFFLLNEEEKAKIKNID
jgi:hypothetical protein